MTVGRAISNRPADVETSLSALPGSLGPSSQSGNYPSSAECTATLISKRPTRLNSPTSDSRRRIPGVSNLCANISTNVTTDSRRSSAGRNTANQSCLPSHVWSVAQRRGDDGPPANTLPWNSKAMDLSNARPCRLRSFGSLPCVSSAA